MPHIILTHKVKDFKTWKPFYDADKSRRQSAGLTDISIFTETTDPNNVHILWKTNNLDNFNKMVADPVLADKMKEAGVISKPSFVILNEA